MVTAQRRKRQVFGPLAEFLAAESTGALLLLLATVAAMVWANSPAAHRYDELWTTNLSIELGGRSLVSLDLRHWVNEALMSLFFFVVGLEIKREIVDGELHDRRRAVVPIVAAFGGMIVPAILYFAFNASGDGRQGWGIPIATDIAFALGALALFGRGTPRALRVFLLSIAIVDDIGSILVIAIFYSSRVSLGALLLALALLAGVIVLWRVQAFWSDPPMIVLSIATWAATLASGIHPTIAAVVLGLVTPADPRPRPSPAERLAHSLHPWSSYVVVPIFALANAGIAIDAGSLVSAAPSPIILGIVTGLVVGKLLGVTAGAYLAVRSGIGALPPDVHWGHIIGVAGLAGIGFTVSLFIAALLFSERELAQQAKLGILIASLVAVVTGALLLRMAARRTR